MSDTANGLLIASGPELKSLGLRFARVLIGYIPALSVSELPSIAEPRHGAAVSILSGIPDVLREGGLGNSTTGFVANSGVRMLGALKTPEGASNPRWVKISSVLIIVMLLGGVIGSLVSVNPYTTALVPIGFSLWAILVAAIRSRDSRLDD